MSTFWDEINKNVVTLNDRGTKPVKKAPTLETSYKKANAEKLIELKDTCKVSDGKGGFKDNHHFIIPTGARRVIGQCQKCKGERWFNNYLETTFNGSSKTTEESKAENDALQDMEVQGTTVQGVA